MNLGVSEKSGTPKASILIGFSIINHPFWGTPIFGNTHLYLGNIKMDLNFKQEWIRRFFSMYELSTYSLIANLIYYVFHVPVFE